MKARRHLLEPVAALLACAMAAATWVSAQTRITPPKNKFSLTVDVEEGQKAAAGVEKELPLLTDDAVTSYVANIGRRLVDVIPENLRHSEFQYTFEAVNVREINAFALPGGPMFVNRGMIESAQQVDLMARRLRQDAHPLAQAAGVVSFADDPEHGVGLGGDHARPRVDQLIMTLVTICHGQASDHQDGPISGRRAVGRRSGNRRVVSDPRFIRLH